MRASEVARGSPASGGPSPGSVPAGSQASPIRGLRKGAGFTQGELGQRVGVTRQTIAAIEKGDYAPSVYLALRIAHSLGSTVEHLFPLSDRHDQHTGKNAHTTTSKAGPSEGTVIKETS